MQMSLNKGECPSEGSVSLTMERSEEENNLNVLSGPVVRTEEEEGWGHREVRPRRWAKVSVIDREDIGEIWIE